MKDLRRIFSFTKQLWPYYLVISILTILIATLSQAPAFLLKGIVDQLTAVVSGAASDSQQIIIFAGLILAVELANTIISNVSGFFGDQMAVRVQRILSQQYFDHLLHLPQQFFDEEHTGTLINRLNRSISQISSFINAMSNNFFSFFLTGLFTLIIISYYSWPLGLALFLLFPLYFWLTKKSTDDFKDKQEKINKQLDRAQGRFAEVIGQIRVVKSFVQEPAESKLFDRRWETAQGITRKQSVTWHSYDTLRRLALNIIIAAAIGYIAWEAFKGKLTIGEFTLLLQLIIQVRFPLFASSFIVDNIQRAQANSKDYFDIMATKAKITDVDDAATLKIDQAKVEFKKVSFAYSKGVKVLKNINFTIRPDSKVALIGESGEGKSTIANLLLRLYEPREGTIYIDGQDVARVTQKSLRQNIAVVFQEAALFAGTIRDNIAYGRARASKAEIEAAAKAANAHAFIMKLPKRYDSEIGERGLKLSGGQKQRIAIARALLKDPPILILDEATSSLDAKAELEVQNALEHLMKNRTTLIIAHRLSTIKHVDKIVALKNGRVAEVGSPKALAHKKHGIYAELLHLQDPTAANLKKLKKFDILSK